MAAEITAAATAAVATEAAATEAVATAAAATAAVAMAAVETQYHPRTRMTVFSTSQSFLYFEVLLRSLV